VRIKNEIDDKLFDLVFYFLPSCHILLMRRNNNAEANHDNSNDLRGCECFFKNRRSYNKGENKGCALNWINIAQLAFV